MGAGAACRQRRRRIIGGILGPPGVCSCGLRCLDAALVCRWGAHCSALQCLRLSRCSTWNTRAPAPLFHIVGLYCSTWNTKAGNRWFGFDSFLFPSPSLMEALERKSPPCTKAPIVRDGTNVPRGTRCYPHSRSLQNLKSISFAFDRCEDKRILGRVPRGTTPLVFRWCSTWNTSLRIDQCALQKPPLLIFYVVKRPQSWYL